MVNYQLGKIYSLRCRDPAIEDFYVGSTARERLSQRMYLHRWRSIHRPDLGVVYPFIAENGGPDNWDIVLIEEYPCSSKAELHKRERYWFDQLKPTLNGCRPTRSYEEYLADARRQNKEVREDPERRPQYLQRRKESYERTKAQQLAKKTADYHANKRLCECGRMISPRKALWEKHLRSERHIRIVAEKAAENSPDNSVSQE